MKVGTLFALKRVLISRQPSVLNSATIDQVDRSRFPLASSHIVAGSCMYATKWSALISCALSVADIVSGMPSEFLNFMTGLTYFCMCHIFYRNTN
jgi:hypothetical protein